MNVRAAICSEPAAGLPAREAACAYLREPAARASDQIIWEQENQPAIDTYNQRVQTDGLWCDDARDKLWNELGKSDR